MTKPPTPTRSCRSCEASAKKASSGGALEASEHHFGLTADDVQTIADHIPDNSSAIVALFEHTWAVKLKEAIRDAGGYTVTQGIVQPEALVVLGAELAAALEAAEQEEEA